MDCLVLGEFLVEKGALAARGERREG